MQTKSTRANRNSYVGVSASAVLAVILAGACDVDPGSELLATERQPVQHSPGRSAAASSDPGAPAMARYYQIEPHLAPTATHQELFAPLLRDGEDIVHVTRYHFRTVGVTLARAKVMNRADAATRDITIDEAMGREIDAQAVWAEHRQAMRAVPGTATVEDIAPADERRHELLGLDSAGGMGQTPNLVLYSNPLAAGFETIAAIVEPDACVTQSLYAFWGIDWLPHIGPCGGNGDHSTRVALAMAAMLGSSETWDDKVGVWNTALLDANGIFAATTASAVRAKNPDLINLSYEIDQDEKQDIEEAVYFDRAFVVNSSGNNGDDPGDLSAQCISYNSLCVGGYDDQGVPLEPIAHKHESASEYLNDPDTGREEPKVVGPYHVDGVGRGTSYAAPSVVGTAGMLINAFKSRLLRQPTLLRAVLMASAIEHPIILDENGYFKPFLRFDDNRDDDTGVGAPNGDAAMWIVDNMTYWARNRWRPSSGTVRLPFIIKDGGWSTRTFKAVVTWDQCPSSNYPEDLKVDVDMVVVAGDGTRWSNVSSVDNYEVIHAQLPPGSYTLELRASRWANCTTDTVDPAGVPIAVAWWAGGGTCEFCLEGVVEAKIRSRSSSADCVLHDPTPANPARVEACNTPGERKRWTYNPNSGELRRWNYSSPLCLSADGTYNGANVSALSCSSSAASLKEWSYEPGTGKMRLRDAPTRCLQKAWSGNHLIVNDCAATDSASETWRRWVLNPE